MGPALEKAIDMQMNGGKTTVLELVRWAMDALPAEAAARRRVEDLVDRNLGGGRIDLRIQTAAG